MPLKPIKTAFNKTTLQVHLAEVAGVEPKAPKAVLAALGATIVAFMSKKGLGEFTLLGLLKATPWHRLPQMATLRRAGRYRTC